MKRFFAAMAGLALIGAAPAKNGFEDVIARAQTLADNGKAAEAMKLLEAAERSERVPRLRAGLMLFRGAFLIAGGDRDRAMKVFTDARALGPDDPFVPLGMFRTGLMIDLSLAVSGLEMLIRSFPDEARALPVEDVGKVLGALSLKGEHQQRRDLRAKLGAIGFGGDDFQIRDGFARSAIDRALATGDVDTAIVSARMLEDAGTLIALMTDRRASALWPGIEQRVGEGLYQPRAAAVIAAERWVKSAPTDQTARHNLMSAYANAGRFADADRVGAAFATSENELKALDESGGWFVNHHAALLYDMGRATDGDRRFASLRVNDIAEKPWLISMIINRIDELVRTGQAAKALPLIAEFEALPENYSSPYGRHIVRKDKLCAFAMLGRKPDVERLLEDVSVHADASRELTAQAYMCAVRTDDAAKQIIAMLESENDRERAILAVLPSGITPGASRDWIGGLEPLLARDDVRRAFDAVARILPQRYWYVPEQTTVDARTATRK